MADAYRLECAANSMRASSQFREPASHRCQKAGASPQHKDASETSSQQHKESQHTAAHIGHVGVARLVDKLRISTNLTPVAPRLLFITPWRVGFPAVEITTCVLHVGAYGTWPTSSQKKKKQGSQLRAGESRPTSCAPSPSKSKFRRCTRGEKGFVSSPKSPKNSLVHIDLEHV
jgi:hypothetical protein